VTSLVELGEPLCREMVEPILIEKFEKQFDRFQA